MMTTFIVDLKIWIDVVVFVFLLNGCAIPLKNHNMIKKVSLIGRGSIIGRASSNLGNFGPWEDFLSKFRVFPKLFEAISTLLDIPSSASKSLKLCKEFNRSKG